MAVRHPRDGESCCAEGPPRVDCCVALGAELRASAAGCGVADGVDWRDWLVRSSLLSDNAWLAVRVLLALFMDGVLFGSVTLMSEKHPGYWCIYLTHWTLVAVCAHLTFSLAGAVAARRSLARGEPPPPHPWWLRIIWSAQAIALPGSLLVFVLFWGLVYPGYPAAADQPINYFVHGANFGAMALDALFSTSPYFFVFIWSSWLIYAIIYVVFTIVYFFVRGTDENGNPYIYAVIYWGSASGASSAGVLTGLIVFFLVPLLGLLAYWLVFLRRSRLAHEGIAAGVPACAPPAGPVATALGRLADRLPLLHLLPLLGALTLSATFGASTPLTVVLPEQTYWQFRVNGTGAVVPYISDTGANRPAYWAFSAGVTLGALLLQAGFRLVYERMDPHLAALDDVNGRYGRQGELLDWEEPPCDDDDAPAAGCCTAPPVEEDMARGSGGLVEVPTVYDRGWQLAAYASVPPSLPQGPPLLQPCWCSAGRWRHMCCCCCSQSLRQQGRSAWVCTLPLCAGMPLLGWCSVDIQVLVHSFGAAAVFGCAYVHLALLARLASARVAGAAIGGPSVTRADARSAVFKAVVTWLVPALAAVMVFIVLPACGGSANRIWNAFLAPLFEWLYAGLLGLYFASLCHEAGLPPPEPRDGAAAKV